MLPRRRRLRIAAHVDRSIMEAGDFIQTDVFGTYLLLEWIRDHGGRLVHVSTDEVYGDIEAGHASREGDALRPSSPYSASKAGGDLQVLACGAHLRRRRRITRGSNNYGPNQYPEKLIPLFTTNLLDGEPVPVYGDGRQSRDFIYVEDHCAGIETVLERGASGEIYNVGGGNEIENLTTTHAPARAHGARREPHPLRHRPPRPRPPLRARHEQAAGPRLEPRGDVRRGPARARSSGTATTAPGGSRSSAAAASPSTGASSTAGARAEVRAGRRSSRPEREAAIPLGARGRPIRPDLPCPSSSQLPSSGRPPSPRSCSRVRADRARRDRLPVQRPRLRPRRRAGAVRRAGHALRAGRTRRSWPTTTGHDDRAGAHARSCGRCCSRAERRPASPAGLVRRGRGAGATVVGGRRRASRCADGGLLAVEVGGAVPPAAGPGPSPGARRRRDRPARRGAELAADGRTAAGCACSPAAGGSLASSTSSHSRTTFAASSPSEMPSAWKPEALQAQAIAARTYAVATRKAPTRPFDLYPDERSQVYGGLAAEQPSTSAAVDATAGQVVIYDGKTIVTYFSSSSGGRTAAARRSSRTASRRRTWSPSTIPATRSRRITTGASM